MARRIVFLVLVLTLVVSAGAYAQVGKSLGVVDANTVAEKDLLTFPNMTPAIVKGLIEKRPFASITELQAYLLSQNLTAAQAMEFYTKAFVHINLNTATSEEILLVPGAGHHVRGRRGPCVRPVSRRPLVHPVAPDVGPIDRERNAR